MGYAADITEIPTQIVEHNLGSIDLLVGAWQGGFGINVSYQAVDENNLLVSSTVPCRVVIEAVKSSGSKKNGQAKQSSRTRSAATTKGSGSQRSA